MTEEVLAQETIEKSAVICGRSVKEPFTITYSRDGDLYFAKALGFCEAIGKSQEQSRENLMGILAVDISSTTEILETMQADQYRQYAHVIQTYQRHFHLDQNN